MKLLMEPVQVELFFGASQTPWQGLELAPGEPGASGDVLLVPARVRWRGQPYRVVQILGWWKYRGRWWTDPDLEGERRLYYRLLCHRVSQGPRVVMEVFHRAAAWTLSRLAD